MLAGAPVEVQLTSGGRRTRFETKDVLFIGGGTFEGLQQIKDSRLGARSGIGLSTCTQIDLEKFGLMPEFAGRFTTITEMRQLDSRDYGRIIRDSPKLLLP
jgi:ATP-dependent Clp protease ATP-binding subunit ClpX